MGWKINGRDLDSSTVATIVEPGTLRSETETRIKREPVLYGQSRVENLGHDAPTMILRFAIRGPSPGRFETLEFIRGTALSGPPWILEAPGGSNELRLQGIDATAVALATVSVREDHEDAIGSLTIEVEAAFLGIPAFASGTWLDEIAVGVEFIANDFWAASNSAGFAGVPRLGLPNYDLLLGFAPGTKKFENVTSYRELTARGDSTTKQAIRASLSTFVSGTPFNGGDGGPGHFRADLKETTL